MGWLFYKTRQELLAQAHLYSRAQRVVKSDFSTEPYYLRGISHLTIGCQKVWALETRGVAPAIAPRSMKTFLYENSKMVWKSSLGGSKIMQKPYAKNFSFLKYQQKKNMKI